jgi:hypothetical protein
VWRRLEFLKELGLAEREGPRSWHVAPDLQPALRTIQRTRDLQRALADPEVSLSDARPQVRWTELSPGQVLTGRVAGAIHDEASDRAHLLVEGTDGLLHVIRQTPAIERRRGEGGLRTGSVVTLMAREFGEGDRRGTDIQIQDHGRLEELREAPEPTTILDREVITAVRGPGPGGPGSASSRFSRAWDAALQERADLLLRAGLLDENERARALTIAQGEGADMDAQGQGRELTPLADLRARAGKPLHPAPDTPGQRLRGEFRGLAVDEEGRRVAVLDIGRHITTIPTERADLEVGHQYEAESHRGREGGRWRAVAWQFEDLERSRETDLSRSL